jgi:hypothetical protein
VTTQSATPLLAQVAHVHTGPHELRVVAGEVPVRLDDALVLLEGADGR